MDALSVVGESCNFLSLIYRGYEGPSHTLARETCTDPSQDAVPSHLYIGGASTLPAPSPLRSAHYPHEVVRLSHSYIGGVVASSTPCPYRSVMQITVLYDMRAKGKRATD